MCINNKPQTKGNIIMLKLSISASILNAISTSILVISHNIKQTENSNTQLKAILLEKDTRIANIYDMPVEKFIKEKEKKEVSKLTTFLNGLNLPNVNLVNNKVIQTTKTEDSLEITINDEYIIDCIEIMTKFSVRYLKPLADICIISDAGDKANKELNDKWFPKNTTKVKEDTKVASTTVEILEVNEYKEIDGWKITPKPIISEIIMDANGETYTKVNYLAAVNKEGAKLSITTVKVKACIKLTDINIDIANDLGLPISLINAIRIYYNVPSLLVI